jgi:ComF family protein
MHILPFTNFAVQSNNPIEKIFWGRLPIQAAHSEFYFSKTSLIQHLIHQLKYKQQPDIGFYLGQVMGHSLLQSNRFEGIDIIVPLPLYPDRERKRGYNQAALIAEGMADSMQIPVSKGNLIRKRAASTQTKKHRIERWQNVSDSFAVLHPTFFDAKQVLLVDDVITTGATLEACGTALLESTACTLSLATLAFCRKVNGTLRK